jgi:CHASE2 domain-containing sensor protein
MTKGRNRQARRIRQTQTDQRNKRNRRIRSVIFLIVGVVFSALFYRVGILHQLERAFGPLEARLHEKNETSAVATVVIADDDYQRLFQSKSPLDPAKLSTLIDAIAAGRPKLVGVDIDTTAPEFKTLTIREWWPPIVWLRTVKNTPGANMHSDRLQPTDILGGRDPALNANAGLGVLIDTEDITRHYQRFVDTIEGPLPSFPWAIASRFDETLSQTLKPSSEELVIGYSSGRNRFNFSASRLLEISKGAGWASQSPIEGRIVLLGGSFASTDRHETPVGTMTGVEVLANAVETELAGGGHHPPSELVLILLLTLEGLCPFFIFHKFDSQFLKPLALSLPLMLATSVVCSLLISGGFAQLPYFLFLLLAMLVYQGFEALRHRAVSDTYAEVADVVSDLQKKE